MKQKSDNKPEGEAGEMELRIEQRQIKQDG